MKLFCAIKLVMNLLYLSFIYVLYLSLLADVEPVQSLWKTNLLYKGRPTKRYERDKRFITKSAHIWSNITRIQASFTMPSSCIAYKCSNRSDQGYALVRYPHDETLKQKWIAAVGRGKNWSPSSSQKLCEIHFKPTEIEFVAGRKRVKLDSVLSRFCTCSSEEENCPRKWRKKRGPLTELSNNIEERCLINNNCIQHQYGCIQICEPLKIVDIQKAANQQIEQIEGIQVERDDNKNLLLSIVNENEVTK